MEEKSVRKSSGMNIGSASIIMVFSVLCLTVFAVLSFVTANNEYKLSVKSADTIKAYYSADTEAVLLEGQIKQIIDKNEGNSAIMVATNNSGLGVIARNDSDGCHFEYAKSVDESQEIQVELLYDGSELTTLKWELVNVAEWSADGGADLWDGEF